jgi:hypothetical protein
MVIVLGEPASSYFILSILPMFRADGS